MLRNLVVPCMLDPLPGREVEVDEFQVCALPPLAPPSWNDGAHVFCLTLSKAGCVQAQPCPCAYHNAVSA